jgi:hypothetical protein
MSLNTDYSNSLNPNYQMADIQDLLAALDVFTRAPDKASLERANSWLQDFQHSVMRFRLWPSPKSSNPPLLA